MPQLSPLNWIFLFLLAWSSIFLVMMIFWWEQKVEFTTKDQASETANMSPVTTLWSW